MRFGAALCALAAGLGGTAASAQTIDGALVVAVDDSGLAKANLLIEPETTIAIGSGIQAVMSLRIEAAGSETGTGARSGFSPISAPLVKGDDVRVEIDEFYLSIPVGTLEFRLGKQAISWGSIDGARVVDTVSPARLTEGLARDPRPDRIAIWAARMQAIIGRVDLDFVAAPDPTVNQLAEPNAAFFPQAPRFLAGLQPTGPLPPIARDNRGDLIGDATIGARLSHRFDATDLRVSFVRGIDQDGIPVFDGQQIELRHPRRHTIGFEFVRQFGAVVGRLETAWTPDARFIVAGSLGTEIAEVDRFVGGIGADFSGPWGTYVNVQMIADHASSDRKLVRPATDVISTLRIQKDFDDNRHSLRAEWLNSLTDGDGMIRLEVLRRLDDRLSIFLGGDIFYGSARGIFGQFSEKSRLLSGVRFAL